MLGILTELRLKWGWKKFPDISREIGGHMLCDRVGQSFPSHYLGISSPICTRQEGFPNKKESETLPLLCVPS